jgi:hypothetical protein
MAAARSPPESEPAKRKFLAAERDDAQRSFGGVVVDF